MSETEEQPQQVEQQEQQQPQPTENGEQQTKSEETAAAPAPAPAAAAPAGFSSILDMVKQRAAMVKEGGAETLKRSHEDGEEPSGKREATGEPIAMPSFLGIGADTPLPTSDDYKEDYIIPEKYVNFLLGEDNADLKEIESNSGASIEVAESKGTTIRYLTLTGQKTKLDVAKATIRSRIMDKQSQDGVQYPEHCMAVLTLPGTVAADAPKVVEFLVPKAKVGLCIGRGGDTIKQLKEKSGTQMQMIQDDPIALEKPLRITGDTYAVERAKHLVEELIAEKKIEITESNLSFNTGEQNPENSNTTTVMISVPKGAVGSVIGKKGETIKRILAETGAKVQFDPADSAAAVREAHIIGPAESVKHAEETVKNIIKEALERQNSGAPSRPPVAEGSVSEDVSVPANKCGLVIGRGGDYLKLIHSDTGAYVELNREASISTIEKRFTITGLPDQIEKAKNMIRQKLENTINSGMRRSQPGFGAPGPYGGAPFGAPAYGGFQQQQPFGGFAPRPMVGGYGYQPPQQAYQAQQPYQQQAYQAQQQPYQQQGYQQGYQQPQQQQQQQQQQAGGAAAAQYPTQEQYLANKEWYNSQGYYGQVPDAQQQQQQTQQYGQQQQGGQQDYSKEWEAYYAAQAAANKQ